MTAAKHAISLTILVVVVAAALVYFFLNVSVLPAAASAQALPIDRLFVTLFSIASVFFALCLVALVYSVVAFRRRQGDAEDGPGIRGNNWLEASWTIIPLFIVMALAVYGGLALNDITRASPQELEVKVVSAQWSWQFEYPQQGISSAELRLPVNRPVVLKLNSVDVVHSFWVPEFRVKQDAVPGMETALRITPTVEGDYTLLCAELCGLLHAYMTAPVRVVGQEEFQRWAQEQRR